MANVKDLVFGKYFNESCAFCGYNEYTICLTAHHIFPKYYFKPQPPFKRRDRYLILCPTCHALLHRGVFVNDGWQMIQNKIDYCEMFYCKTPNIKNIIKLVRMVYSLDYLRKSTIHL